MDINHKPLFPKHGVFLVTACTFSGLQIPLFDFDCLTGLNIFFGIG